MIKANLREIESLINAHGLKEDFYQIEIKGVSTDSRDIQKGNLFIPLVGENFDGHKFLKEAKEKGASAALVEESRLDEDPGLPLIYVEDSLEALQNLARAYLEKINPKVIAISGSNGKTSTKDLLASILEEEYKTHKTQGNFNNHIGLPLTILEMEEDVEMAVLEMGISDFGEMRLLSSIAPPDLALITNATEAHLDDLGTRANIAKAKMEFLENMKDGGLYLYCYDDSALRKAALDLDGDFKVKSYGLDSKSDLVIGDFKLSNQETSFYIPSISDDKFTIPLLGKHQVLNGTAAIILADELGVSLDSIRSGLEKVDATGMRNELKEGSNFTILDDSYKSNPSSLLSSLETMYSLEGYSQKIVVIGDMLGIGDDIEFMHREIGRLIREDEIDYIIGIGYYSEYIIWEAEERFGKERLFHFEEKPDNIAGFIKDLIIDDSLILVKASRPLELDTIVKDLLDE